MMMRALPVIILLIGASYLLLWDLDGSYLWQDEAESALVSETILKYGIPKGYDGFNYFSQQGGGELGSNHEWKLHGWLHFYWQALFFWLFGSSTFTARLPFALLGIATVMMLYVLARQIWQNPKTALLCALCLALSVPFLLLARQSRYYSMAMFFTVYALLSYYRLIGHKKQARWHMVLSLFGLFHSHYLYSLVLLLCFSGHLLVFHRSQWRKMAWIAGIMLLLTLPFLWWLSDTPYARKYSSQLLDLTRIGAFALTYLRKIGEYVFLPGLLVIPVVSVLWQYRSARSFPFREKLHNPHLWLMIAVILVNLVALAASTVEFYFRYTAPLLPVFALLTGRLLREMAIFQKYLPWLGLAVWLFLSPMKKYIESLHRDFRGPIGGIVSLLKEHAHKDDLIAISYGDLPLKFYLDNKIYGGLTGESVKNVAFDWIIFRKYTLTPYDLEVKQTIAEQTDWSQYQQLSINFPDTPFENRESPYEHYYQTVKGEDPVKVFRRIK